MKILANKSEIGGLRSGNPEENIPEAKGIFRPWSTPLSPPMDQVTDPTLTKAQINTFSLLNCISCNLA